MGTTSEKLTYLNTTKGKIKDSINLTGANILNTDTFRSYATKLKNGLVDIINNGIDTLYSNFPKVTAEGTKMALNNTYEAPIKLNVVKGDTQQDSYAGNQLLDFSNPDVISSNTTSTFVNDVLTITTTSKSYASVQFDITNLYKNNPSKYLRIDFNSIDIDNYGGGNIVQANVTYTDSTPTSYVAYVSSTAFRTSKPIPSDTSNIQSVNLRIFCNNTSTSTGTYSVTITKPIFHFGQTEVDFEPYVGGKPSPSPDYPQEVKVVTGEKSYNLIDFNNPSTIPTSVRLNFDNNIANIKSKAASYRYVEYDITELYKANAGKTLRFCYDDIDVSNQYGNVVQINVVYSDSTPTSYQQMLSHELTRTNREIPADTSNISQVTMGLYTNNSSTSQVSSLTIVHPMLIFGTEDKTYMPYGNFANIEVHSKNLLDLSVYPYNENQSVLNGGSVSINNGILTIDGTNATGTVTARSTPKYNRSEQIMLRPGTYYFGVGVNGEYESNPGTNVQKAKGKNTLTENYYIKQWFAATTSGTTTSYTLQIEKGEEQTTYQEYQTPQTKLLDFNIYDNVGNVIGNEELCKIGEYQDTLQKSVGNQLIDFSNPTNVSSDTTSTFTNDILTITSTTGTYKNDEWDITNLIKNNAGKTLYFVYDTIDITNQYDTICQVVITYTDSTPVSRTNLLLHNLTKISYTIPSDVSSVNVAYFRIYTNNTSTSQSASVTIAKPMLQFGTETKTYEPYGKVWYKKSMIGKFKAQDGLESNGTVSTFVPLRTIALNVEPNLSKASLSTITKCNLLQTTTVDDQGLAGTTGTNKIKLQLSTDYASTLSDAKTYLENNNLTIYYVLQTPTYKIITNENIINSLESVIKSYENETHIISTDALPPIINVSALEKE